MKFEQKLKNQFQDHKTGKIPRHSAGNLPCHPGKDKKSSHNHSPTNVIGLYSTNEQYFDLLGTEPPLEKLAAVVGRSLSGSEPTVSKRLKDKGKIRTDAGRVSFSVSMTNVIYNSSQAGSGKTS